VAAAINEFVQEARRVARYASNTSEMARSNTRRT
jgi:hypothetical protein